MKKDNLILRMGKLFMPGAIHSSGKFMGLKETFTMLFLMLWGYVKDFFWLWRKKGFRSAKNFAYVKMFVPCGEGAGGIFYFFFGWLIRKFPFLAKFPRFIEVEVTTICNKRCIICEYVYWPPGAQEKKNLTLDSFKKIAKNFPRLIWTNLTGEGSSFLNKDYLEMIRFLKEMDIPVFLVDHFDGMNEEIAQSLIKLPVEGIYISFDAATKQTYEKIKVGCNYDRVVSNIKNFLKLKQKLKSPFPEINYRYVITKYNVNEIPLFLDLIAELGGRKTHGFSSRVDFCGLLSFPEIKHLETKVAESIIQETLLRKRRYKLFVTFSHMELKDNVSMDNCLAWQEPYFMMGGYVMPCCQVMMSNKRPWLREHAFGNIYEDSFEKIWNSQRYKKFRSCVNKSNSPVPLFCKDCRAFYTGFRQEKYGVNQAL